MYNNIEEKLLHIVKKNIFDNNIIQNNDIIVVCLSGGRDSICLFDILMSLSEVYNFKIIPMHINHGIRGKEAERDLEFVTKYCNDNGYDVYVCNVNALEYAKNNSLSIEESARILRYIAFDDFYNELRVKYNNQNVFFALAHHKKDQAETILHNIIRGTGISGLIGMEMKNNFYLRPLLNIDKEDIDEYIEFLDLDFVDDTTNFDDEYTRNNIRLNILPRLNEINKNTILHLCDLSNDALEIEDYFNNKTKVLLDDNIIQFENDMISVNAKNIKQFEKILKYYIIKNIFDKLNIKKKDITRKHYNDLIDLIDGNNNRHLDLPYNVVADKKNNILTIKINNYNLSMKNKKRS